MTSEPLTQGTRGVSDQPTAADQPPSGPDFAAATEQAKALIAAANRAILAVPQEATNWKQRAETAEASVKELGVQVGNLTGELEWQKKQTAKAEAELAEAIFTFDIHGFRRCESSACNCGRWHPGNNSASARLRELSDELNEAGFQPMQKTALVALKEALAQLTAANKRLAKVRDSLTRLSKWIELSPFAEDILAEAQAALAEGEG